MFDYAEYIAEFEKLQGRQGFADASLLNRDDHSDAMDPSDRIRQHNAREAPNVETARRARGARSTRGKAVLASIVSIVFISAWLVTMAAHIAGIHRG